jgi:hypothetical protein
MKEGKAGYYREFPGLPTRIYPPSRSLLGPKATLIPGTRTLIPKNPKNFSAQKGNLPNLLKNKMFLINYHP